MTFDLAAVDLTLVRDLSDVEDMMRWLGEGREFLAVDVETTGLNCGRDKVRLCQFGDTRRGFALDFTEFKGVCREVIERYQGKMVCHNILFDSKMLKANGIEIPQIHAHDTMMMAHLINPMRAVGLKPLSVREIDRRCGFGQNELSQAYSGGGVFEVGGVPMYQDAYGQIWRYSDLHKYDILVEKPQALAKWDWATIPIDHPSYWIYSAMDTVITAALAEKLWPQVQQYRHAYEIEMGAIHVLRDAELAGLKLDMDYCALASLKLKRELAELEPQLPCNPNSENKIVEFLQERGAVLFKKTEKGNWSVDDEVLAYWEDHIPEAGLLRRARKAQKLLSSYFSNFEDMNVDGILHCNVRPCGAKTGRMSITDPALQTLPRGCAVRDGFIPREGSQFLISDYSQMELRVMAHYAQEEEMMAAFERGDDLHNFVAAAAYGPDFTKKQRSIAKNAGFAKIYGASPAKFALTAKISEDEARAFLARYDEAFPGVTRWQQETIQSVRNNAVDKVGHVTLRYGRKVPVPIGEAYKACNYLVQGGCAQIMKLKLIQMSQAGLHDFIRLPVHDEVICEVPNEDLEEARQIMDAVMPDRQSFDVVLDAEAEVWGRWGDKYVADGYDRFLPEYFGAPPSV